MKTVGIQAIYPCAGAIGAQLHCQLHGCQTSRKNSESEHSVNSSNALFYDYLICIPIK